jgi:NAD(P)-dependent dehydrogenase (short-subunit alcohol dehydrogenase family)
LAKWKAMQMSDFSGKTAVVTGAARGQGRAMAIMLAKASANVAICDVGKPEMATVGHSPLPER